LDANARWSRTETTDVNIGRLSISGLLARSTSFLPCDVEIDGLEYWADVKTWPSSSPRGSSGVFLLRVTLQGFEVTIAGLVLSSYFAGFTVGVRRCGPIIERIDHIRTLRGVRRARRGRDFGQVLSPSARFPGWCSAPPSDSVARVFSSPPRAG
jgi:hypothetical protein